ncbi:MAG: hypothetical protein FD176_614 [Rhodospirillaceae bacterium]|nr:MAG: hypothetical protein FD176_614 [Rhodospirillaceae bacterium]TNC94707.1 MAG: hypothetical protein FD119_2951 [Stygiobacter sp.]
MAQIPPDILAQLNGLLARGQYAEADKVCRRLLRGKADKAQVYLILGQIQHMSGDNAGAVVSLRRSTALASRHSAGFAALATVLMAMGNHDEALHAQMQAGACPDAAPLTLQNLGVMLQQAGRVRDAIATFRRLTTVQPGNHQAWQSLGRLHRQLGEHDDADMALMRAAELANNANAWKELAQFRTLLGNAAALDAAVRALALAADDEQAQRCHLDALFVAGRLDEAEAACAALRSRVPDDLALARQQAAILAAQGHLDDASALQAHLLERDDLTAVQTADIHLTCARLAYERGSAEMALQHVEAAADAAPGDPAVRMHRGWQLLARGQLDRGWEEFEYRFQAGIERGGILPQSLPQQLWRGEDLRGKSILLWGEQGIGDDILQCSALDEVIEQAAVVHLLCDPRLVPVLRRDRPDSLRLYPRGDYLDERLLSREIDYQCSTGTMLRYLRPTFDSFPRHRSRYLQPNPERVTELRNRYAQLPGRKIGLSWRSKNLRNGADKSCPLINWDAILTLPGITFVNLQYGDVAAELHAVRQKFGVTVHTDPEIDQMRDIEGFFAQLAALDAVVSISNATAHAAGALGCPLHVLLSANPLWVWFLGRSNSPWYPAAKLYRQERLGVWPPVLEAVATALRSA